MYTDFLQTCQVINIGRFSILVRKTLAVRPGYKVIWMIEHQVLFIFNDEDKDEVKKVTEELKKNMSLEYTISTWKELKEQAKPSMNLIEKNDYNLIVFFL